MFRELLDDGLHIRVCLPPTTYYIQHIKSVVATLPRSHRFKFGITVQPHYRYYEAHYGYSKHRTQQRDGAKYVEMVVVYAHHSRDVVAILEHSLIDVYAGNPMCANRKTDFDNHIRNDDSCSENEDGPSQCTYATGKLCLVQHSL